MIPSYFSIIPVAGKTPLVPWTEFQSRLATAEEKAKWGKTDIGIVTGPISKIFVLDIDGEKGAKSIEKFQLPRTPQVRTPHGVHYYFRWTEEMENRITTKTSVLDGIDVRGNGGYVKFYGWAVSPQVAPFAKPPQWLIDLLPNKENPNLSGLRKEYEYKKTEEKSKVLAVLDGIKEGNRNESFTKLAGSLRARGYKVEEIFTLLVPKAKETGFSERELQTICNSVGRYEIKEGFKSADLEGSNSLSDFLADAKEIPYVVPGFIAENTINLLAGLAESRKSWVLLDLAIAIASGTNWLTKHPCHQKRVLVIDQERPKLEMQRRIKTLLAGRGLSMQDLEGRLIPKAGTTIRINLDQSYEKFCRVIDDVKPEVILIDSLKTFQTGVITDNQSMQEVMEKFKELRAKYGLTFIILHHENKGGYLRTREGLEVTAENIAGAASIIEVPEGIFISVNHDSGTSMLHHVKNSYGSKNAPFLVRVVDQDSTKTSIKVEAY